MLSQPSVCHLALATHTLNPSCCGLPPYHPQEAVIDTIVAKVQGVPGDDRCVLLLGYPDQMEAMMREANPGLARRFQLSQAWHFEDYSQEDLLAILKEAAAKRWVRAWGGLWVTAYGGLALYPCGWKSIQV